MYVLHGRCGIGWYLNGCHGVFERIAIRVGVAGGHAVRISSAGSAIGRPQADWKCWEASQETIRSGCRFGPSDWLCDCPMGATRSKMLLCAIFGRVRRYGRADSISSSYDDARRLRASALLLHTSTAIPRLRRFPGNCPQSLRRLLLHYYTDCTNYMRCDRLAKTAHRTASL